MPTKARWVVVSPEDVIDGHVLYRGRQPVAVVQDVALWPNTRVMPVRFWCWCVWRAPWVLLALVLLLAAGVAEVLAHTEGRELFVAVARSHPRETGVVAAVALAWLVVTATMRTVLRDQNPYQYVAAKCVPFPKETTK